ncbi:MAG TPA: alpha-amylase family glycosyl hydrolase [Bacillaceae bacterium]|nr:alpha-amylase family glycosyl hydrolase [Bacillaceae bacterium]
MRVKNPNIFLVVIMTITLLLSGCMKKETEKSDSTNKDLLSLDPHGVYYEIFVRSFADSDGDGIGDLNGAISKLDYLVDLGIEGIWLMPINPSPSYHGYDVTDYREINPEYGSLQDMKRFVTEAHRKGIKVIMDLVINHTSKEHKWFQKALAGEGKFKDYYVWSDENTNISALGEWSQKVWHGSTDEKYEGIFWDGMPDLNFDNHDVRDEIIDIAKYWLEEIGVDGFRLDAAKHIYSESSSKNAEEKNHEWWREFREVLAQINPEVILVGEVWDSAAIVAPYLDEGLTSAFNFDLSTKILESVKQENDNGIVTTLIRTREYFHKISNGKFIDSIFLTNHDMPRVMTELNGNIDHAKMAASLLLTLPGNPFLYYGEEIGLKGPKPDEEIREPFIWKKNKNAPEQTTWQTSKHNRNGEQVAVEAQMEDENSLLHHYRKMIRIRRSNTALIAGEIEKAFTKVDGMVNFKRVNDGDEVLVLHNLTNENKSFFLAEQEQEFSSVLDKTDEKVEIKKAGNKVSVLMPPYTSFILRK